MYRKHQNIILTCLQVACALCAGYFVWYAITDSDIFWHLTAGRKISQLKQFIYTDPFAFTLPAARWIDIHWFFQLCMYGIWRIGGYFSLIFIKTALITVTLFLGFRTFRQTSATMLMAGFITILIFFQRYLIPLRPMLFTLLFIVIFIRQLEQFCKRGNIFTLIPIFIVQVIWVNSQGLFLIGVVLAGAYAIGERINAQLNQRFSSRFPYHANLNQREWRLLLALPVILTAVSLINPYGWHVLAFAVKLFIRINPSESNIYAHTIIENMPLFSMIGTRFAAYVVVAGVLTLALICTSLYSTTIRIAHLLCAAAGLLLAVMAQRNGILYTFFALPALLWNSSRISLHLPRKSEKIIIMSSSVIVIAILAATTFSHAKMLHTWPHALSPFSHPVHSAEILQSPPRKGHLFNADRYGGYLLWKNYPERTVSHDTRLTLRPGSFYLEYLEMVEQPKRFYPWAEKWNISAVCLPTAPIERYLPLAAELYRHPDWHLIFTDGAETFFLRSLPDSATAVDLGSAATIQEITRGLSQRFQHAPALLEEANTYLARFCLHSGEYASAQKLMEPYTSPSSIVMKSIIDEQAGNSALARNHLEKLVADHRSFTEGHFQLALFHLRHNNKIQGVRQLSIVLKKDPFHRRARNVLLNLTKKQVPPQEPE